MSLLAEVAARAGVAVEGVVRVVTRQPVSRRIEQRVVETLDSLEPEQLRSLERLARAGLPEVVSPAPAATPAQTDLEPPAGSPNDEVSLRLGMLLEEVALRLDELRREQLADRQDRVDDLAVLVDLMTNGWRGVDRRLARLERSVARLEPPQEAPTRLVMPMREPPPAHESATPLPEPEQQPEVSEAPTPPARRPIWRRVLGTATPVLFVAGLALALLVFELLPSAADAPRLATTDALPAPPRSLSSTTGGLPTPAPASPRILAWPGRPGVSYYRVRVLRGRALVFEARPRTPRVVLPAKVTLTPGIYSWSVRVGGAPPGNRLGATVVDSTFVVAG